MTTETSWSTSGTREEILHCDVAAKFKLLGFEKAVPQVPSNTHFMVYKGWPIRDD